MMKRQTVVSQFYQLDRLVVEGQKTVSLHNSFGGAGMFLGVGLMRGMQGKQTGDEGGIVRQTSE